MNLLVISSPSPERQKNVRDQFDSQSLKFIPYMLVPAIMNADAARYGIAKSHKKCVQIAKDNNWSGVIIMEDDANLLSSHSLKIFLDLIQKPKDNTYDLFLAGIHSGEMQDPKTDKGYTKIVGKWSGLHMYYIPAHYYDKFLEADEQYNIDFSLSEIMKTRTLVAVPMLVSEIAGYSFNAKEHKEYSKYLCSKYRCI